MGNDDERPKKSWREIDRARESGQARGEKHDKSGEQNDRSAAYRAYKSQLNRLFDGGSDAKKQNPEDEEALGKLLDSSDERVVLEALVSIERLLVEGRLKRAMALKARLKTVQATIDEPRIQEKARELLSKF